MRSWCMWHVTRPFQDDIIPNIMGVVIAERMRKSKLPAYVHMHSGENSRDIFSNGELRERCDQPLLLRGLLLLRALNRVLRSP